MYVLFPFLPCYLSYSCDKRTAPAMKKWTSSSTFIEKINFSFKFILQEEKGMSKTICKEIAINFLRWGNEGFIFQGVDLSKKTPTVDKEWNNSTKEQIYLKLLICSCEAFLSESLELIFLYEQHNKQCTTILHRRFW